MVSKTKLKNKKTPFDFLHFWCTYLTKFMEMETKNRVGLAVSRAFLERVAATFSRRTERTRTVQHLALEEAMSSKIFLVRPPTRAVAL